MMTGLATHGGPGTIGPRIFQMAPRFLRSGAQRAPTFFEPSTYKSMFGPPNLGLGPMVFKSGGLSGPREKKPCDDKAMLFGQDAFFRRLAITGRISCALPVKIFSVKAYIML